MSEFYCAGNWKMNKTPEEALVFARELSKMATETEAKKLVLLPSALTASAVVEGLRGSPISWGGQNCYHENKGAFTGENSPQTLKTMGARFCLVGHSERRHVFGEPDEMIAKKVLAVQDADLIPILCVGETVDDRRWSRTQEVIVRQTRQALQAASRVKPIWLAYEPVWAIGTGQVATPSQVEEAHSILRKSLREWNASVADRTPILYGGSVKADNAKTLSMIKDVDGFLIGGASLDVQEFIRIFRTSTEM